MAILSGRFAEQVISPTKPLPAATLSSVGPGVAAPSPVCTPIWPVTALKGCCAPLPETKPALRRGSHQLHAPTPGVHVAPPLLSVPARDPLRSPPPGARWGLRAQPLRA